MSRELEMLRNVTCNGDQMVVVASPYLRAILARMEAAERVCEAAKESRKVDADLRIGAAGMMNVKAATEALDDALRNLETKETSDA